MDLLHQLARDNEVQLEERLEDKMALAVMTQAQEKEMEQPELGKSDNSIVGDAEFVNPTKRDPEIEEGLREKQEEAQKEPNPVQSVDDAAGTASQEETGENSERRRKAFYLNDEEADSIPVRRSPCNDEPKGKPNGRKKDSRHNSESGKEASDKGEGTDHGDESREKTAQRILYIRRRKGQDQC